MSSSVASIKSELTKVESFSRELRKRITQGVYTPSKPIPPLRQIASEFGVSPGTANLAMAELRAEGLIESHRGRGNFVKPKSNSANHAASNPAHDILRIGLICPDYRSDYVDRPGQLHPSMLDFTEGTRRYEKPVFTRIMPTRMTDSIFDQQSQLGRELENRTFDGVLVYGVGYDIDELQRLADSGTPVVLINQEPRSPTSLPKVRVHSRYGFELLSRRLVKAGYESAIFLTYLHDPLLRDGSEHVVNMMRSSGFCDCDAQSIFRIHSRDYGGTDYATPIAAALDTRPQAIITSDEVIARRTIAALQTRDLVVGRDISLVSFNDNLPQLDPLRLTTLNSGEIRCEVARMACDLVAQAIAGENIERRLIELTPSLIEGESVCRLDESKSQNL